MTTRGPSLLLAVFFFFVSVCVFIHVCISLSWGLSAIITSCGLITSLPKKSRDLKVIITWHVHFSSHLSPPSPSPHCSFHCGNHGNNRLEPVCDTHTASFCVRGVFRVQVVERGENGGRAKVQHHLWATNTHTQQDYKSNFETFLARSYSNKVPFVLF